jgi:SAM-dependent methyltransferase
MTSANFEGLTLREPPRKFFMSLRDIFFWIRSAQADAALANFQQHHKPQEAFDLLYEGTPDPYGITLPYYRYQHLKYDTLLSLLPNRHYASALDLGCGLGLFTRQLSEYVDHAFGVELSQVAVEQARSLSSGHPNVRFEQANILDLEKTIKGRFDLVVLADVLYYLSPLSDEVLKSIAHVTENLLEPNGILLLVNHYFFGFDVDSKLTRQIHDSFRWTQSLNLLSEHRYPFYLVSLLQRVPMS